MIDFATVVPGSESPAGDGINGAMRCTLIIPNARPVAAVIKRGPPNQILAEAFCAVLLSGWGLGVPKPYFVQEGETLAFASTDDGYPSLKHRFNVDGYPAGSLLRTAASVAAQAVVCTLPTTPLAAAADEAIDNRDRNLGNVLWDGSSEQWIDHAAALGNDAAAADVNKLCAMAITTGQHERMAERVIAQWAAMDRSQPAAAAAAMTPHSNTVAWQALVEARVAVLGQKLLARFPRPTDLLSNL